MTQTRRKKDTRQRGTKTHGWGSMKKHRGAGNRGGRGMAGTGKRCDTKKPSIWKDKKYFGKHGFTSKSTVVIKPINIFDINQKIEKIGVKTGEGCYSIDLSKLGYNKLLGTGKPTFKYEITVDFASAKAVEKIESMGGKTIIKQTTETVNDSVEPVQTEDKTE